MIVFKRGCGTIKLFLHLQKTDNRRGEEVKKTYQRLPESELDIMLVLWNGTPPMTRPEIEGDQHEEKPCSDNGPVIVDQTGSQKFRRSDQAGQDEPVYTAGFSDGLSGT